jgi:exopolysaccharide biosynthesis polyprenyl glycosylphosphotransferase
MDSGFVEVAGAETIARWGSGELAPGAAVDPAKALSDAHRPSPPLRKILVAADLAVILAGCSAVVLVARTLGLDPTAIDLAARSAVVIGLAPLLLSANGLYRRRICAVRSAEIARLGRVSGMLGAIAFLLHVGGGFGAAVLAAGAGVLVWFTFLVIERGLLREWIHGRRAGGDFGAPVIVLGGEAASTSRTANFLAENPVLGFEVKGLVGPSSLASEVTTFPWLGGMHDAVAVAKQQEATGVILDAYSLTGEELNDSVQRLTAEHLHVHISSGLRGVDRRRLSLSPMADETFLHVAPLSLSRPQVVAKRAVDLALGGLAMLLFGPLLALCGLAIWAYDRGPVLYRQERVGLDGERFTIFKLRTMVVDADQRLAELQRENARNGPLFKLARDPRITPFGRFLRATSLDEIPQLFNVLEGTMSLVGPRPALPSEVAQFDDRLIARLTVKPGVTGLWQVEARDLPNFDLYRRFDLLYVQNWSLSLDLAIIARTVTVVALRSVLAVMPARLRGATVLE